MTEAEDLAARAMKGREVVLALLERARALRAKAEKLEKQSDRLRAAAARDLAEYLEGAVAEIRGP